MRQPRATEAGLRFGEIAPVFRTMATPLWSRSNRVGAKSFGVTVKRVRPKVLALGGIGSDGQSAFVTDGQAFRRRAPSLVAGLLALSRRAQGHQRKWSFPCVPPHRCISDSSRQVRQAVLGSFSPSCGIGEWPGPAIFDVRVVLPRFARIADIHANTKPAIAGILFLHFSGISPIVV